MESSTELIVHAAGGHCLQSLNRHLESFIVLGSCMFTQQIVEDYRSRKLRSRTEATVLRIEGSPKRLKAGMEQAPVRFALTGCRRNKAFELGHDSLARTG